MCHVCESSLLFGLLLITKETFVFVLVLGDGGYWGRGIKAAEVGEAERQRQLASEGKGSGAASILGKAEGRWAQPV